jgi:hypothetical protein
VSNILTLKAISEQQQDTGSMRSLSPKPGTWQSTTKLSQSEIESLRQDAKQASARMKAMLKQGGGGHKKGR